MLGEELARKVQAEEEANLARHKEELAKKAQAGPEGSFDQGSSLAVQRQREINAASLLYTDAEWFHIMTQIATHTELSRQLLGDDVTEETFSERLADLMRRKRQAVAETIAKEKRDRPMTQGQQREFVRNFVKNQSCSLYQTGWSMAKVTKFTDARLKEEFEKIQRTLERAKILDFKRSLPRSQPALEEPSSKKIGRNEDVPAGGFSPDHAVKATQGEFISNSTIEPAANVDGNPKVTTISETPVSVVTMASTATSIPAKPTSVPTVVAAGAPLVASIPNVESQEGSIAVGQAVQTESTTTTIPTDSTPVTSPNSFGQTKRRKRTLDMDDQSFLKFDSEREVNALYRVDRFTKYFTHLREILHLVTRHDLIHLYHLVDKFYETNVATGVGLLLWGDLKVLFDSTKGGAGYSIWGGQQNWQIRSWRLYTFPQIHVLETMVGQVMYMFVDIPYPLSIKLMERMLKHKLELAKDVVGNDLTTAEQLISFIKSQLVAA
ncbi:hypothetical protein Tco_0149985 [Tanacetum coccineum]